MSAWLASRPGAAAVDAGAAALDRHPGDPLAAGSDLRRSHPDLSPSEASSALEQAALRREAVARYGLPGHWLYTRDGLEQATRPQVSSRRAALLADSGARTVLDLTGGLGADVAAFLDAGLHVIAVERDPGTAALLAHNCPEAEVVCADAVDVLPPLLARLSPVDVVFADPARRVAGGPRVDGRARPERDPERWSPPWSAIAGIAHPRIAAKVAPGFDAPAGWRAEWVSVDRTLVECALYSWLGPERAAIVCTGGTATVITRTARPVPRADHLGGWLHEPDPAVLRAGAQGALLDTDAGLLSVDEDSTWLTSGAPSASDALRSFEVVEVLEGSARQQRARLSELGVTRASVKSRDTGTAPHDVLRELGLREGSDDVVAVTRRDGRVIRVLCRPAAARGR